jgi:foldase protein PrsA
MFNHKLLYAIIAVLVLSNGYFLISNIDNNDNEVVAKVGKVEITKNMWSEKLTKQYGQDVLKGMINREVVFQLAKKQGLKILPEVIDKEVSLYKVMYDQSSHELENLPTFDEAKLREEIEYILLLEEIYTQDIVISDEEIRNYYDDNKELFNREDIYYLSHIVVQTKEEADEVLTELQAGSSFEALAMERSIDMVTASRGGDIGYIERNSFSVPEEYVNVADSLSVDEVSAPIATGEGFAIIVMKEEIPGTSYAFEDMKREIRRQLALQQIEGDINAEHLWNELGVVWQYNEH